ncbi:occlusion-derived virus envelope/capsid protein [Anticarsia gemmatalis nucleopolyhedrovirus]|uniref:Occlusion-derived virus envelope/capsid protein n=1 Tax=Anticarsia gemmatalis multiple nucleopolyhedrovirus TaxID=268591 RepID=A0A0S3IWY4_9ABAC|nr:occlusion-derived virus envelope/capsid protein [Anticarsia gemmatalis nucleopolyhedrovirus]ABI13923.1 occlusion-derived virus envelope/capsid protein [Anticarsia gemmatalis multiple nucleopolyhedrovirus]ALR69824.1 occlusion-derived virus envelope/capsid protein [Anticarsia gemmatalis multiple nucleopolyhedrovirus]ALR69982.1 occlusion-derived virus envelope/capsid protein [Anticarsia gemmatalis multiple nucleopolyhedrovirus]ALR70139.1 occlusion-derived virus envelope/capsid protein [Anticars
MRRVRCNKVRTVTEIVHNDAKLPRTYDLAEFDLKNLSSLESFETTKIKLVLSKYMAMINTLEMTQPLLEVFRNRADTRQIVAVILATMGFVHNRFNPLVTHFNNKMEFVMTETPETSIPGEPILFTENDGVLMCAVDRPSIVKMLSREFDVDATVDMKAPDHGLRIAKTLAASKRKRRTSDDDDYEFIQRPKTFDEYNKCLDALSDFNITETEATQYLTLLLIVEHAYLHYYIYKNYGVVEYSKSLLDHSLFVNKLRSSMSTKAFNLLLSKFRFGIEEFDKISGSAGSKFAVYNFTK